METQLALIELFEYKVADLLLGHVPIGGRRTVLELRETLLRSDLAPPLLRRFGKVDREFKRLRRGSSAEHAAETLLHGAAPTSRFLLGEGKPGGPEASAVNQTVEARTWHELQHLVWFSRLQERVQELVLSARTEPGHPTLRSLYAVTETAERALRGVAQAFPVPLPDDSLLSLEDREIAVQLGESLCELLLSREGETAVLEALSRTRAQPFPPHPDEAVLAARIDAVEREPISQAAREDLIRALRSQYPQAPDPRERPAVRLACAKLEQVLESVLQERPRLAGVPERSILYSPDLRTGLSDPPEEREELVIYLGGHGQETYWHDLHLRWQRGRQDWQLMLDKQLVLLRPTLAATQRHLKVRVKDELMWVYHSGDYVLLRHTAVPRQALQVLAQQGLMTAQLLDPALTFANLRLARALARAMRGSNIDRGEFMPASAEKYHRVDAAELLAFARQGAVALLTLAPERNARDLQELAEGISHLLHVPQLHAQALQHGLRPVTLVTRTTPESTPHTLILPVGGEFEAVLLRDHPLNLHFQGRVVTLKRDYKGDVAVLLPGGSAGEKAVLRDLLVVPMADLSLILIKWHDWVAVATAAQIGTEQ